MSRGKWWTARVLFKCVCEWRGWAHWLQIKPQINPLHGGSCWLAQLLPFAIFEFLFLSAWQKNYTLAQHAVRSLSFPPFAWRLLPEIALVCQSGCAQTAKIQPVSQRALLYAPFTSKTTDRAIVSSSGVMDGELFVQKKQRVCCWQFILFSVWRSVSTVWVLLVLLCATGLRRAVDWLPPKTGWSRSHLHGYVPGSVPRHQGW